MKIHTNTFAGIIAASTVLLSPFWLLNTAVAQPAPSFAAKAEAPAEEKEGVEWKAGAQASAVLTTGNSQTSAASGNVNVTRTAGLNKLSLEAGGAYARSSIFTLADSNGDGDVDSDAELDRDGQTTTKMWYAKGRYDRFFSKYDSVWVAGLIASDEPAGKEYYGGGQIGYSRLLLKDDMQSLTAELGYDYTFEDYIPASAETLHIHSARAYLGYEAKLSEDTSVKLSAEGLVNLNELDTPTGTAKQFDDLRVNGLFELNTKLYKNISFGFSFLARYDNRPAPLAISGITFDPTFVPAAEKLDTITKASLIVTFL